MSLVRNLSRRYHSSRPELHDVVVLGAGPAGLALTAALASSEAITATHRITLLEGQSLAPTRDWNPNPSQWSNRVSSITADNINFLSRAGVWKHVDHARTRGIQEMQVWDGLSDARIEFQAPTLAKSSSSIAAAADPFPLGPPRRSSMATLTENLNLQRAALRRIEETGNVELVDDMRVESIVRGTKEEGGWPVVNLRNRDGTVTRSIRARLLIGADGANSPVKSYSEIETFGWAYDRRGVVSSLELDPSAMGEGTHTAWQRFLPEGPIAFLPLSDTNASLVWSTTPAYAALLNALPPAAFTHLINLGFSLPYEQLSTLLTRLSSLHSTSSLPDGEQLSSSLSDVYTEHVERSYSSTNPPDRLPPRVVAVQPGTTASFPLRLSHTSSYVGRPSRDTQQDCRTVLVGDAAHTVHPLAGQGLNLGLSDSQSLVRVLEQNSTRGTDLGSFVGLVEYNRERYFENHLVLSAVDHLESLFKRKNGLVVWLRSNGFEVVNELEPIKRLLMGKAGAASSSSSRGGGGRGGRNRGGMGMGGGWGMVASVFEGAAKVKDSVGFVSGLVGGFVKKRATDFIVKGK